MISLIFSIVLLLFQTGFLGNNLVNINAKIDNNYIYTKDNVDEKSVSINNIWEIEIPKINLKAPISEGTTEDILNLYVGHFEETSKEIGNIGLAAHNRGYNVNYFENIKNLEINDEIYYTFEGNKNRYIVNFITIIKDTDWSLLENTKENKLTLITCVENEPQKRRCIQAIRDNKYSN